MTVTLKEEHTAPTPAERPRKVRRVRRRASSLRAHGEPMVWLTGGSLAVCLFMIFGLVALVIYQGGATFWPRDIVRIELEDGTALLGEVTQVDEYEPSPQFLEDLTEQLQSALADEMAANGGRARRRLLRTENFGLTGTHFDWVDEALVRGESQPEWAVVVERRSGGRLYGEPSAFVVGGEVLTEGPDAAWTKFEEHHSQVLARADEVHDLEQDDLGRVNARIERERLELRSVALKHGLDSPEWRARKIEHDAKVAEAQTDFERISGEVSRLREVNSNYELRFDTSDGGSIDVGLANIVRAVPANQLGTFGALRIYLGRWWEFLTAEPREANSEGGVWPAIFGTVVMTLIMSILVVPFGVLAALYLREYAKQGFLVSVVRIAVNNLAGVPSIVFGVFGLGFFCYIIGSSIDELFFSAQLPNPTYGKGGILWASLTLALLTLPVVIVATEEALSAVPNSMREGSYACGATKWQTIRRIVIPRAQPGIMTGAILAIARGAGEVAPLMLVGAVKLAPDLPVDLDRFPYVFPERSFMHLGFHIYDVGFQSQNSEAAKPMVYTTTLLLIAIVVLLNVIAIWIRARLRRRFQGAR